MYETTLDCGATTLKEPKHEACDRSGLSGASCLLGAGEGPGLRSSAFLPDLLP